MPNRNDAFALMLRAAQKMTPPNNRLRYPSILANALASELETFAGSAAGRAAEASNTLVSSMFAYGLYDIITHFGMTEADMKSELNDNLITLPKAFANYWAHRDALNKECVRSRWTKLYRSREYRHRQSGI